MRKIGFIHFMVILATLLSISFDFCFCMKKNSTKEYSSKHDKTKNKKRVGSELPRKRKDSRVLSVRQAKEIDKKLEQKGRSKIREYGEKQQKKGVPVAASFDRGGEHLREWSLRRYRSKSLRSGRAKQRVESLELDVYSIQHSILKQKIKETESKNRFKSKEESEESLVGVSFASFAKASEHPAKFYTKRGKPLPKKKQNYNDLRVGTFKNNPGNPLSGLKPSGRESEEKEEDAIEKKKKEKKIEEEKRVTRIEERFRKIDEIQGELKTLREKDELELEAVLYKKDEGRIDELEKELVLIRKEQIKEVKLNGEEEAKKAEDEAQTLEDSIARLSKGESLSGIFYDKNTYKELVDFQDRIKGYKDAKEEVAGTKRIIKDFEKENDGNKNNTKNRRMLKKVFVGKLPEDEKRLKEKELELVASRDKIYGKLNDLHDKTEQAKQKQLVDILKVVGLNEEQALKIAESRKKMRELQQDLDIVDEKNRVDDEAFASGTGKVFNFDEREKLEKEARVLEEQVDKIQDELNKAKEPVKKILEELEVKEDIFFVE